MNDSSWFQRLFGFSERSPEHVHANLGVDGAILTSRVNGASYRIGRLETPSLGELRARASGSPNEAIRVRNVVGEAGALHADPGNAGALFQVASQFNLLEMPSPSATPEDGVSGYVHDRTQGPACALAAAPATVYRNYFAPVGDDVGQTSGAQIDCLQDVHDLLAGDGEPLWTMRNGYALPTASSLERFDRRFAALGRQHRDKLRAALRIGLHRDVEVTRAAPPHLVSQSFCSALPLSYGVSSDEWSRFARLILEATYEATLLAAAENAARGRSATVFLTLVGGGVFGNRDEWIRAAMRRALKLLTDVALDVRIVHYRAVGASYRGPEAGWQSVDTPPTASPPSSPPPRPPDTAQRTGRSPRT